MNAMTIAEFGGPDVFAATELDEPKLRPGHVLIRVKASSVNPIDWKIRKGLVPAVSPAFPAVLHGDVAGVVEAVADDVGAVQPGDEVYACAGGVKGHGGALAELMLADADLVAHKPQSLDFTQAAALSLVSITAWEALIDRVRVQPGQRVLVHGGTGGVGHIGVQLAKAMGAVVATTVSTEEKAEIARNLGADDIINYKQEAVADYVQRITDGEGFDVVFDTVGGDNIPKSFEATAVNGTVATIAARTTADLSLMHAKNLTFHAVFMLIPMLKGAGRAHHGEILTRLARMVDNGSVRPLLDPEVFDFTEVANAHAKLENGKAVGKIVLRNDF